MLTCVVEMKPVMFLVSDVMYCDTCVNLYLPVCCCVVGMKPVMFLVSDTMYHDTCVYLYLPV